MEELWARIERWLAEAAPLVLKSLAPGASESDLRATEAKLGLNLPGDFRESCKIHNGQILDKAGRSPRFIEGEQLYSLRTIISQWELLTEAHVGVDTPVDVIEILGPVRRQWGNAAWIPIAGDSTELYYFLDFDPPKGGTVGQVIRFQYDALALQVLDHSFRDWFEEFADQLEGDVYVYSAKKRGLIRRK